MNRPVVIWSLSILVVVIATGVGLLLFRNYESLIIVVTPRTVHRGEKIIVSYKYTGFLDYSYCKNYPPEIRDGSGVNMLMSDSDLPETLTSGLASAKYDKYNRLLLLDDASAQDVQKFTQTSKGFLDVGSYDHILAGKRVVVNDLEKYSCLFRAGNPTSLFDGFNKHQRTGEILELTILPATPPGLYYVYGGFSGTSLRHGRGSVFLPGSLKQKNDTLQQTFEVLP